MTIIPTIDDVLDVCFLSTATKIAELTASLHTLQKNGKPAVQIDNVIKRLDEISQSLQTDISKIKSRLV